MIKKVISKKRKDIGKTTRGKMRPFHDFLIEQLQEPEFAAEYLTVALEEEDSKMFLVALRDVAEARGGLLKLSRKAKLNRANLYKILSKDGNPEIQTLSHILDQFGLRVAISAKKAA